MFMTRLRVIGWPERGPSPVHPEVRIHAVSCNFHENMVSIMCHVLAFPLRVLSAHAAYPFP